MVAHRLVPLIMWVMVLIPAAAGSAPSYTLEELKTIARTAHPTLESAEAGIAAAAGELRQARAYANPELIVAGGRGRPRDGGASRSESSFEISQPIEWGGVRRWRVRLAELGRRSAELERSIAQTSVDAMVTRLSWSVLWGRRRAEIGRESVEVARRLHQLVARRVELGEASPLEAAKARSEWFARRRDVLDAERAEQVARAALDRFCGGHLATGFVVAATFDGVGTDQLPADLVDRLRTANPVLLRAGMAAEVADARIEVARKGARPKLNLFAGHDIELDRTASSVGAGLELPVWNRNRGAIDAAAAEARRAESDARAWTRDLEIELSGARVEYDRAVAGILLHREGWTDAARQSLEIAIFSFENGEASLLEVLDAQRGELEVRLAEAESWAALNLARAEIERLIGGPLTGGDR